MGLVLKIALRYLKSKKTHSAVNIISIISVCGVILATAALVCVLSVFNGFSSLLQDRLSKLDPDIEITATQGKTINNADSVAAAVHRIAGVELALPTIEDHALAVFVNYQMPVTLKGVPEEYDSLTEIRKVIIDGDYRLDDGVSKYAVLSVGAAVQLHARPDFLSMIRIYAPQRQGRVSLVNPSSAFRTDSTFVSAIYQVEQSNYDRDMIYVPIAMARELFDYDTQATNVEVKLLAGANSESVMKSIQSQLGNSYTVKDRLMQQAMAFRLVNIEKWVTFLLLAFILIIATFNVISTLSLLIIEKDESIKTFRNLGATNKQITRIFVTEGWLISLIGAVLGITLGVALCLLQEQFGLIKLHGSSEVMIIQSYPVAVECTDLILVFALVAIVGLLTSFVTSFLMRHRLRD